MSEFEFKQVGVVDFEIEECRRLLMSVFPGAHHFSSAYLTWLYKENPSGEVVGYNAYAGQRLAAHYVTVPIIATIEGELKKGLLSLNTATHPDFGGKGLFTRLAQKTYDYGAQNGYTFVLGVSNAQSTPGFKRKLGFQVVGALDAEICLGFPREGMICDYQFQRNWDQKLLEWRLQSPHRQYFLTKNKRVYSHSYQGLINNFITQIKESMDFNSHGLVHQSPLIRSPFVLWAGLDRGLKKGLSIPIPKRLRPSPLNLIFKNLSEQKTVLHKDEVKIHLIDFDLF